MNCFSEFKYSMYCDGELPADEAHQVELHLIACSRCRHLVEALREENRALAAALQGVEEPPAWSALGARRWTSLLWQFAALIAIAAIPYLVFNWVAQLVPLETRWLNPFDSAGLLSLLPNTVFYLTKNGGAMLSLFDHLSSLPALLLLLVLGVLIVSRFRSRLMRPGFGVLILLTLVMPGYSLEVQHSKETLTIPADKTINDTLIAGADTVVVDGVINGDLIAGARRVLIHGTVKGDVVIFAQKVEIPGTVTGNIFAFAQSLEIRGHAENNLYGWIQSLYLPSNAQIDGNAVIGASDATFDGAVMKDVLAFAGAIDMNGSVGRDVTVRTGRLMLSDQARIGGNLSAHVENLKHIDIASGASIGGKKEIHLIHHKSRFITPKFYFWKAVKILGALLVGLLFWLLAPAFVTSSTQAIRSWGRSLGLGFAILVGTPVAIVILCITLIGLPLGIIGLLLYLLGLYLGVIVVGLHIGRLLIRPTTVSTAGFLLSLLVGLIILSIVFELPYGIGLLAELVVFCFALGALGWQAYRLKKPQTN